MHLDCLQRGREGGFVDKLLGPYSLLVAIAFLFCSPVLRKMRDGGVGIWDVEKEPVIGRRVSNYQN